MRTRKLLWAGAGPMMVDDGLPPTSTAEEARPAAAHAVAARAPSHAEPGSGGDRKAGADSAPRDAAAEPPPGGR
jgi:hypothetical protein